MQVLKLRAGADGRVKRRRRSNALIFGGTIVTLIVLLSIFAPLIAPHDPYHQELSNRLIPPVWIEGGTWVHPLGTDQLGRDYLSRLLFGARISLMIGLTTALISGCIGVTLGLLAGYFGGAIDTVVTYLITVRLSLPAVIVSLAVVSLIGSSFQTIMVVLGLLLWDQFAIVSRSLVKQNAGMEYVAAAKSAGFSTPRILIMEILPNILPSILVVATIEIASAIMVEASLSFLGLGVQPPMPSWGLMLSEGKDSIFFTSWLILFPGLALFVLILGINFLGDGLRDHFAPDSLK